MSKRMELLAIATTAIRDIYMGYPDKGIAAPSGMGTKTLLRDLVGYLRENGLDDEGGWDCDATEDIPVKREPAFEPFKLVAEAYATDEFGEGPSWAEVTVTPEFLQTLERLCRVCQDEKLESVTVPQGPDRWDMEDDLRIRGDSLRVWRVDFWFEAHPKHRDYSVETRSILIDHLIRVARRIASSDAENPLPDYFTIRNGIVFYSASDPADLADSYLDCISHEDADWYSSLGVGDEVWWNDPDDDICSGYYKVTWIDDGEITPNTVVRLDNSQNSIAEAYVKELSPMGPGDAK